MAELVNTKKLNIVMFGQKHTFYREGGVEVVVKELASRMVAQGHTVTCYDRSTSHALGGVAIDNIQEMYGIKIIPVWTIEKKGLAAVTSSISAAWKASNSSADVIHIHAEGPAAMCRFLKKQEKKVIVTIHGLDWKRSKWNRFASTYIKWGEKQAVKYADEIIVLSHGVQKYFEQEYGIKTTFIPNGVVPHDTLKAKLITENWGLEKDSYVLFLGRIVPEKGIRYLVDAWKNIKTEKKLVIVGGSSDTLHFFNELKEKTKEDNRIIFTGFQQGKVLEELYSNSYVYCLPSDLEGMPLSLLEAMSYGNCCLVSDISECAEVVEDKAILFRKSDVNDLERKLQWLLDNPSVVKKYRQESANFVNEKYCWDDIVNQTLKLYLK